MRKPGGMTDTKQSFSIVQVKSDEHCTYGSTGSDKSANMYLVMVELQACGEWNWDVRKIGEQRLLS